MALITCTTCGATITCLCGECHLCEVSHEALDGLSPQGSVPQSGSQKVKGIWALQNWTRTSSRTVMILEHLTKANVEAKRANLMEHAWPLFARPCPITPKHGFVDSRPVSDWESVWKVWDETLAADPDGELILMPLIAATKNAIWTPSLVTVGAGHDGATAGKDTVCLPLIPHPDAIPQETLEAAAIGPEEDPYIEAVYREGGTLLTQLRAGPKIGAFSANFIPARTKVRAVIKPNGEDLLAWAARIEGASPGTVVYHPGGSPADHYYVHARLSKIPVVTTFEPTVGQWLNPTKLVPLPHPQAVLKGLAMADKVPLHQSDLNAMTHLMLAAFHANGAMSGAQGVWIGVSAGLMFRLGSLALRGEARHRPGLKSPKGSRDEVYVRMASRSLSFHRAGLNRLAVTFGYGQWAGSYGGQKWAGCAASLVPLAEGIRGLAQAQDDDAVGSLLKALNVAINQAHNGGWWLNKFVPAETFDTIQEGAIEPTIRAGWAAHTIATWAKLSLSDEQAARLIQKYADWPVTRVRFPSVREISMVVTPATGGLTLSVRSRMLGAQFQALRIPLDSLGPVLAPALSNVRLLEQPDGAVKLIGTLGAPDIVLWESPPIRPQGAKEAPTS